MYQANAEHSRDAYPDGAKAVVIEVRGETGAHAVKRPGGFRERYPEHGKAVELGCDTLGWFCRALEQESSRRTYLGRRCPVTWFLKYYLAPWLPALSY